MLLEDKYGKSNKITIQWLGQIGFWIEMHGGKIIMDPYLSKCLTKKICRRAFSHLLMLPNPIEVEDLISRS